MDNNEIHHVSDTALWIAAYRALESEQANAAFNDPLARRLAGSRGFVMVETTPNTDAMAFAMVTRTTAIDRLVHNAIQKQIDTVINLGAGLDTRPYRMNLPASLHWIEVDFSSIINYKTDLLKNNKPVCRLQRISCDLSKDTERIALLKTLGNSTKKALVITEGVVGYLTNEQAEKLAKHLFSITTFQYWIMDYSQGRLRQNRLSKKLNKKLEHAPWLFNIAYPIQFFQQIGWNVNENIYILDEADRIGRKVPLKFPYSVAMKLFPKTLRDMGNKTYGFIMFGKD